MQWPWLLSCPSHPSAPLQHTASQPAFHFSALDVTHPCEHSEFSFILSQNWYSQHSHTFLTRESPLFMVRSLSIHILDLFLHSSSPLAFLLTSPYLSMAWKYVQAFPFWENNVKKENSSFHSSFCLCSHGFFFLSLTNCNLGAFFTLGRFSTSLAFHCCNSVPSGTLLWISFSVLSHFWEDRLRRWTFWYCVGHLGSTAWKKKKFAWVHNFSPIGTVDS